MILPQLNFRLRSWVKDDFTLSVDAIQKLTVLKNSAGSRSDRFQQTVEGMLRTMLSSGQEVMFATITSSMHTRALTYLLLNSEEFRHALVIDESFLSGLTRNRPVMSRLALTQLIRLFFEQFNSGLNGDEFELLAKFIRDQLDALAHKVAGSDLGRLQKHSASIFSKTGPDYIAIWAIENNIDLDIATQKQGTHGFQGGQFYVLCRHKYYLETLRAIPVGEPHSILDEILKPTVHNVEITPGRLLGHEALAILISRADIKDVSEVWQNVVLTIAGDPRVPKNAKNYQKWWAFLDDDLIKKVRAWLAKFDLKLFLQILEDSAHEMGIEDMERMFTSRKVFMEGLLEQGLVTDSRLFLSRSAISYINRTYKKSDLTEYVKINSQETSMIYLNVSGVHMVEGSHSFKIRLMRHVPQKSRLLNYAVKRVDNDEFRTYLKSCYHGEFPNELDGYFEANHDIHLNWQHKTISFFAKNRITVSPSSVLLPQRYKQYKQKFGL